MPAEHFQLPLTHEGVDHTFSVEVLNMGPYFHFVVRSVESEGPKIHVRPGISDEEHWHFTCRRRDKATKYYPAGLLELIGEALDRYNFTTLL
jgi:hypothetical protein